MKTQVKFMSNLPSGFKEPESLDNYLNRQEQYIFKLESLLIWALYHHQGQKSPVGQPIRKLLGITENQILTDGQIKNARQQADLL
jgi:hypothetical protein